MKVCTLLVMAVLAISFSYSDCESNLISGDQLDSIRKLLPEEYRNTNFTLDDAKRVYRDKCKSVLGAHNETLYEEIESGVTELGSCLTKLANFTTLEAEIRDATPIGELDTVFSRYCGRVPTLKECVHTFGKKLQPCLTEDERKQYKLLEHLGSSLLKFLCLNDGNRIALFIAEGGRECLQDSKTSIVQCLNSSVSAYLPKDGALPEAVSASQYCHELETFQNCTVLNLEKCKETTPANLVDSIFNYIKRETNCVSGEDTTKSSADNSKGGVVEFVKGLFG